MESLNWKREINVVVILIELRIIRCRINDVVGEVLGSLRHVN